MSILTASILNQRYNDALWPRFESVVVDEVQAQCNIYIGRNLSVFEGHFPQQAVVPGVVLVHWVGELAQTFFACKGFNQLKKTKFSNIVLPSSSLTLVLEHRPKIGDVSFEYKDADQRYSSGVISFSVEPSKA